MHKLNERLLEEHLESRANEVNEEDLENVMDARDRIKRIFEVASLLRRFKKDVATFLNLIRDFVRGAYDVSWRAISIIVATLLYVLFPFDLIPDIIPVVGWADDAMMVSLCLFFVNDEMRRYRKWQMSQVNDPLADEEDEE
mgnify:CR=1 FL=1